LIKPSIVLSFGGGVLKARYFKEPHIMKRKNLTYAIATPFPPFTMKNHFLCLPVINRVVHLIMFRKN